jgi:hypothetical protein
MGRACRSAWHLAATDSTLLKPRRVVLRRDMYHPVWQIHTGVAFILSADWPAPSLPTLAGTDNGYLHVRHPDLLSS